MSLIQCPGPALSPVAALRRVADEPCLVMLHGCGLGWSYLAWGMTARAAVDAQALAPTEVHQDIAQRHAGAWSAGFRGGNVVQCDYEFPARPATLWPVDALVSWDPQGRCTLHARDERGLDHLRAGLARDECAIAAPVLSGTLAPAWNADTHRARVDRLRAYIAAGDIYQANLTVPFIGRLAPGRHRDLGVFLALTADSPAPYSACLRSEQRSVISHSPECFLHLDGALVISEPIKGTRRRVAGHEAATRAELLASAKDRAELAMIVDLVRNDLGRIAEPGSVRVVDPARIMDLPHVHHLVARVAARRRAGAGLADVLQAAFPAGSITGAPKIRAMQLIRELESAPRGAYCGAFGWLGDGNHGELAVAIRTLTISGDQVRLDAGGGIVADSTAAAEWDEVRAKASAMARALGAEL